MMRCDVCGDYRPDERIGVLTTTVEVHGVEVRQNVRYCNDRPACVEGAAHVQFVGGQP